jgi:type IV secretion system protein VirB1
MGALMPELPPQHPAVLTELVHRCAPLVHPRTLTKIVLTESGANPFAIGVVGGRLERQPRTRAEATATVRALQQQGINFSAGLGQINVGNWARLGLDEHSVFEPCQNLGAAQAVLKDCFDRSPGLRESRQVKRLNGDQPLMTQQALRQAFSCYYSGNFSTGFDHGYVAKVVAAKWPAAPAVKARRQAGPDD